MKEVDKEREENKAAEGDMGFVKVGAWRENVRSKCFGLDNSELLKWGVESLPIDCVP